MIKCTTIGVEPSKMCYEICVLAYKCGALKTWEREKQRCEMNNEPQTCENRGCKNYDTINDHCMFIEQCHYEPKESSTVNPYKIVLEDLKEVPMFTGKYDAKNGRKHFMFGIMTVMEYIAGKAGDEEYSDMFLENMNKSVYGDKAVERT